MFEFGTEVKQGELRPEFTNKVMVQSGMFTVRAVAVKEAIKPHRHHNGVHVRYIINGRQTVERPPLRRGWHVPDVCCGTGASMLPAAQADELPYMACRCEDMTGLGFPARPFDAVDCGFGICLVPDVAHLWHPR